MLPEYSHTNSESLSQISTPMAEIQNFFYGIVFFYWHTLYMIVSAWFCSYQSPRLKVRSHRMRWVALPCGSAQCRKATHGNATHRTRQMWHSRLHPSQLKLTLDLGTPEGCKAECPVPFRRPLVLPLQPKWRFQNRPWWWVNSYHGVRGEVWSRGRTRCRPGRHHCCVATTS